MKLHTTISSHVILLVFALLLFACGCKKTETQTTPKPAVTIANLQTAYAKALIYSNRYKLFVKQAEKERNHIAANLYRAIAHSEEIRATNHTMLLRNAGVEPKMPQQESIPVGTTAQTLRMSMSSEDVQHDNMYPDMIRTAVLEKDTAAVEQFTEARDIDGRHRQLLFETFNAPGKFAKVQFILCSRCGYIFTSDDLGDCPVCNKKNEISATS